MSLLHGGRLAASPYWTYLIHLPLVLVLQFLLLELELPWLLKLALAVTATWALCLASHALLVQRTALRRHVG
ncbi:MAG: hypothetical protein MEQ07_08460 [Aquimonas sp.]|nr:hypothetical protein [Aquimonas sp.]